MPDEDVLLEREASRARLEAALAAAQRGRGRIVSIEGEAGIGKTALVLDFVNAHRGDARVHMGGCENLATPEPLGPLRDVARESQGRFQVSSAGQMATFEALLRLLVAGRGPALLVIEDLHWADDSTLDLIRYLGRRIRMAPILTIVTLRHDEVASQARLASLWADVPRDGRERVELRPLSLDAVSTLALRRGRAAREVFEATGGNPFHVTEYLASGADGVPRSLQESTLARAAGLSAHGRRVLDWAAIFPRRIDEASLRRLARDDDSAGIEACLRSGMLNIRDGALAFRHELARRAIQDAMAPLRLRELHAAALAMLKAAAGSRAAELAHHAQQAGATQDMVTYSVRAADEAAALGAHHEAMAHLAVALDAGGWLSDKERDGLLERLAQGGEGCGAFDVAVPAIERAIASHRSAGDVLDLGNALRIASRLYWQQGRTDLAEAQSREALDLLRGHADSWQYAMALSGQSQIDMLADRNHLAIAEASEAMARARRLERTDIHVHALTNLCAARCADDPRGDPAPLLEAIAETRRLGEPDALPRLYSNLTFVMAHGRRYDGLFEHFERGIAAAAARDNVPMEAYIRGQRATALLDLGRIDESVAEATLVLGGPAPPGVGRFPAQVALSRARTRRGAPDEGVLDEARALPTSSRDVTHFAPIATADAEAHWLGCGRPWARVRLLEARDRLLSVRSETWLLAEVALWLTVLEEPAGLPADLLSALSPAHQLHIAGRWREAARAWRDMGCPYEQALALARGDEADQRQALGIFEQLAAAPAARRLRREMRAAGVSSVPAGPRAARRNHPAGLTPRQSQVLELLAQGLSNAEIAGRLGATAKTVEHHVGAVLAAFEAPSRLMAVQIARQRGVLGAPET